jgi:hypothetical protein
LFSLDRPRIFGWRIFHEILFVARRAGVRILFLEKDDVIAEVFAIAARAADGAEEGDRRKQ